MTLPKLSEIEMKEDFDELYQNFSWFLNISGEFFDLMSGNTYENYYEENDTVTSESTEEYNEDN